MTSPIWALESRANKDQQLVDSEWQSYQATHKQLMDALFNEIKGYADQTGLTPLDAHEQALADPASMQQVQPPTDPQVARAREDLVSRAHFWNIPNPEQIPTDQLAGLIADKRQGIQRAPEPTMGTFSQAVGASAVEASSIMAKLAGNVLGQVGQIPFAGKFLSDMLNTERSRTWLYSVASKADEDAQMILASQPAQNVAAAQFLLGAGKMAGYTLPAIAAWEGLGAAGAALPEVPWLARFATPLARNAVKGGLSALVLTDPDASKGEQAFQIGLGTVLGGLNIWGRAGAAAGLGSIGAGLGGEIGQTPEDRRRHAIEWGLGGAVLPFLAPMLGNAAVKVAAGFRNAFDDAIPVDQSQRPPAPGETVVSPEFEQVSGNPPPPQLPPGGGGGPGVFEPQTPQDIIGSSIRAEPARQLGPGGEPVPAEPQAPGAIGAPRVAGLLPATNTSTRLFDVHQSDSFENLIAGQTDYAALVRQALSDEGTAANVMYNYTSGHDSVQSLQYALDVARGVLDDPRAYTQGVVDRAAELASTLPPRIAALDFNAQRYAPLEAKGLASVTQGPSKLLGSKVSDAQGRPLRVYHGTALDFAEFDPAKADPEALYGPGLYHTEDQNVASGYASTTARGFQFNPDLGVKGGANVRPAWLDIKNPFNIDQQFSDTEVNSLLDRIEQLHPDWDFRGAFLETRDYVGKLQSGEMLDGNEIYTALENATTKAPIQGPSPGWSYFDITVPPKFGKANVNQALQQLGYDGITHIGGRLVGDHDHRVWIAFRADQVHAPYNAAPLDAAGAQDVAASVTKQATIMESATLPEMAAKPEVTTSDAVSAAKRTNPGGTSVLQDVGDALQVLEDHPDVRFVQRNGKIDALIGEFTDEIAQEYQEFGMYTGQSAMTARGIEGEIMHINGRGMVTLKRPSGPPLRVKSENLLPGKFGDPQRSAPDLWNQFKASLLRYVNEEAGPAGMAPADSIWDVRAQETMQQHLSDFMDARGINDPGDRQVIDTYMNQRFVQEAQDLDPEMRDLQASIGDAATAAANEREFSEEDLPVSIEEVAQSKGFVWITDPGTGGGSAKDILNPEGGWEVPFQSEDAGQEFLHNVNRTAPDVSPAGDAPVEVMESAPADGDLEPRHGVEEFADLISDHLQGFGAGGGAPPEEPPTGGPALGPDEWARIPGNAEKLGAQFQRLRKEDHAKLDALREQFKSNVFRYTRYLMQKGEEALNEAGITMGRMWMHYDNLETARTKADYEARPWLDEYGDIMRQFTSKIIRKGDVTRIHEIEDTNARMAAWWRLKDKYGYSDAKIKQFIAADEKLADFNHRWFQYLVDDPNYGLTREREIFRYMSHVRARQARGDTGDVFDPEGFLSPYTEYFAEFAREGNLQFRVMDARELGNYMVRAGMFKKWQSGPWQELVSAWQDPRVPSEFQDIMLGHARLMKFGYDGRGDLLVNGTQWMLKRFFNVVATSREVSNLINVPVSGMYRALLGGRTSIFFRDAIQPLFALAKVRTDVMAGVYRDVMHGTGENSFSAMRQRGLEGGWITPDAPAMEAAGMFEQQPGLRQNELLNLTPAQARIREVLASVGDVFRDAHRLRALDRATNTLTLYGKEQGINRMIVGESAYRQATTALSEYRAAELTAILNRDPSMAMTYQDFADRSFFSSFSKPIQRRLQELVDAQQDDEAAKLFARQVADWSQFKYGRREQPQIVRGSFGRLAYTFGNFTGQFAEAVAQAATSGSANPVARARQASRALMVIGAVSYGLHELEQKTGWGFSKWAWPNAFKFAGSPVLGAAADAYQAASGAIALSEGRTPSLSQAGALQQIQSGSPGLQALTNVFPYTGYLRTGTELYRASQGTTPVQQAARYLVTGDRGSRGLLMPQDYFQNEADRLKQSIMQYEQAHPGAPTPMSLPPTTTHPGSGAIP